MPRLLRVVVPLAALALLIQVVPYRPMNPPGHVGPAWADAQTQEMAERACFDCHSNQARVPWYGNVAPVAWVVRHHMDEGRAALNLSEMDRPQKEADEAGEKVLDGEMPPGYYLAMHPEARLSDAERRQLAAGLDATLGGEGAAPGQAAGDEEDDD